MILDKWRINDLRKLLDFDPTAFRNQDVMQGYIVALLQTVRPTLERIIEAESVPLCDEETFIANTAESFT